MFVDVRSFTTFAERLRPIGVVAALNRLFEGTVRLIHRHGGHDDKYRGDGLFAGFLSAAASCRPRHSSIASDEFGTALSVGVGLNSGPVVAGNVGGAGRLDSR